MLVACNVEDRRDVKMMLCEYVQESNYMVMFELNTYMRNVRLLVLNRDVDTSYLC